MHAVTMMRTGNSSTLTVPAALRGPEDHAGTRYSVSSPSEGTYVFRRLSPSSPAFDEIEGWLDSITISADIPTVGEREISEDLDTMRAARGAGR